MLFKILNLIWKWCRDWKTNITKLEGQSEIINNEVLIQLLRSLMGLKKIQRVYHTDIFSPLFYYL
jgi:hypothetical protein